MPATITHPLPVLWVFLAAPPASKGAAATVAEVHAAAVAGRPVRAILSGAGLEWAPEAELAALARLPTAEVCLCSQSARRLGEDPAALPPWIRWSSVASWLADRGAGEALWGVFP